MSSIGEALWDVACTTVMSGISLVRFADRSSAIDGKQHASLPGIGIGGAGDVAFKLQLYESSDEIDTPRRTASPYVGAVCSLTCVYGSPS